MGRPELGTKCTCTGCQERFYDLKRVPAVCPKCGAKQPPTQPRVIRPPTVRRFGSRMQRLHTPVPTTVDDEVEPADAVDDDADNDEADADDDLDADDDIGIDPAVDKSAD